MSTTKAVATHLHGTTSTMSASHDRLSIPETKDQTTGDVIMTCKTKFFFFLELCIIHNHVENNNPLNYETKVDQSIVIHENCGFMSALWLHNVAHSCARFSPHCFDIFGQ